MEDEVSDPYAHSSSQPIKSFPQIFDEMFPFYLNCGMTYEQYWYDDPWLVCAYYDAWEMRRDETNYFAWLNGVYHYIAVATAISNVSFDGKHHKTNDYLDKPLPIRPKTEEELEAERQESYRKIAAALDAKAKAWKERHKDA